MYVLSKTNRMLCGLEKGILESKVEISTRENIKNFSRIVDIVIDLDWKDVFAIWEEALTGGRDGNVRIRAIKEVPYAYLVLDRNSHRLPESY